MIEFDRLRAHLLMVAILGAVAGVTGPALAQEPPAAPPAAPPVKQPSAEPAQVPAAPQATTPALAPTGTPAPASNAAAPTTPAAPGFKGVVVPEFKVVQPEPVKPKATVETAVAKAKLRPVIAKPTAVSTPSADVPQQPSQPTGFVAEPVATTVKLSPIGGSEIAIEKVAGSVSTVSAAEVARQGSTSIQEALQAKVPGITLNDLQGSGFQTDVQYHGFSASPVNGVAQGLAIYQNGVRINEVYGDTVNLDLIPSNAINDIAVMGSNPAFGLNAIGGSISIGMKDGFNYHGGEIDARVGSFGRRQGAVQAGVQSGGAAIYFAYEDVVDNGWRNFSPSNIKRFYGDIGFKDGGNELHFNLTRSDNSYGVVAATPLQLLDANGWNSTFTSPQTSTNSVTMPTVNATVMVNPETKISGIGYYRSFQQRHVDGNLTNAQDCGAGSNAGFLCDGAGNTLVVDQNGNRIPSTLTGEIDRSSVDSESYGGSLQGVNKSKLFGHTNQFLIGTSIDHGVTAYKTSAELASIDPSTLFITGSGLFAQTPFDLAPRNIRGTNDYYGVFASDAFDVTDKLTITLGGRFNYAQIQIQDLTGAPEAAGLNGTNTYERFNPSAGATYKLVKGVTLYGSYAEANRAPTVAELACADPLNPCVIQSFLTSDPHLKQVVSHTFEAGLRGDWVSFDQKQKVEWSLGAFHALNTDDLIAVANVAQARAYFLNAGETLRQGIDASLNYRNDRVMVYGSYSYTDATFQTPITLASPNNPMNPDSTQPYFINVHRGNTIPGIPNNKFKAGIDYWLTPKWKAGIDMVAATSQFYFGDQNNQNKPLSGYAAFNLHTSYDLSKNIQLYGLVNNLLDSRYGTYGSYTNLANANSIGSAVNYTDPRTITPAAPFAAYGGIKVKF